MSAAAVQLYGAAMIAKLTATLVSISRVSKNLVDLYVGHLLA